MAAAVSLADLEKDPRLFLYTSLTAGSSHIITATSRMETILKANKIPFQAIDLATDEKARRLWQRRGAQRKLPGLVKEGFVIGDLADVEEWNEFGELRENIGPVPPAIVALPPGAQTGVNIAPPLSVNPTATGGTTNITAPPVKASTAASASGAGSAATASTGFDKSKGIALPGAAEIAARNKPAPATTQTLSSLDSTKAETLTSSAAEKKESIATAEAKAAETEKPAAVAAAATTEQEVPSAEGEKEVVSEAKEVPKTGSEKVESEAAPVKEDDGENEAVTKGVEGLKVDEAKAEETAVPSKTQDQSAKEPEAAATSVED